MTWIIVGGVGTLVATAWAARLLGRAVTGRSSAYFWAANVVIFLAAVTLVVMAGPRNDTVGNLLYGAGLGLGFGGIAGLRNGWKAPATAGSEPRR